MIKKYSNFRPNYFGQLLLLGVTFVIFPSQVRADFILHSWENHHERKSAARLLLGLSYYTTGSNFGNTGTAAAVNGLQNYTRTQGDLTFSAGLLDQLSIYARASWAYINIQSSLRPGNAFGFPDQTVGLNLRVLDHDKKKSSSSSSRAPFSLDFQFQTDFAAYLASTADTNPLPALGDASTDWTGGFFITAPLKENHEEIFNLVIGGGYTYRTLGFSSAIPWSLSFQYFPVTEGFFAQITGFGMVSLRTDSLAGSASPRTSTSTAGSYIVSGMNPSLAQLQGKVGYRVGDKSDFFLSATQSVWGQNSPNGLNLILGLQTRFGGAKASPVALQSAKDYGHSNSGFLSYSTEAKILKAHDRLNLVKIDKGSQDGIEVDYLFDIFRVSKEGVTEAVARARVTHVRPNESALEITEFYKEVWIEDGFTAKRLIE